MRRGRGFTLLEVLVVIAIISLLVSILVPAFHTARQRACLAVCQADLKSLSAGIWLYTADHQSLFPPFAFSSACGSDLLLSGHWGGSQNPADPDLFGRFADEMSHINLNALAYKNYVHAKGLLCPGAEAALVNGEASYFSHSDQFSTYCLRFPHSEDLFREAPLLRSSGMGGPDVLDVYRVAASGYRKYFPASPHTGQAYQVVPYVHSERTYHTTCQVYDPARGALLADAFWMRDDSVPASAPGAKPVLRHRCHDKYYNVLYGHGGVTMITDDGTVESNDVPPGQTPPGQAPYYDQAETIWGFFDSKN
jgi:prepilin-type N-terminal cleavage/methylation domain-containing protein